MDVDPEEGRPRAETSLMQSLLGSGQEPSHSRRIVTEPQMHRLPSGVMWSATVLTAVGMAFINFISLLSIEYAVRLKFRIMQTTIVNSGLAAGIFVMTSISVAMSFVGAALILFVAPNCGGSGLPESKCYLNGSSVLPRFFTWRNLFVRIMTSILANTAGFPVGREGPTVTIGGNLAFLISHKLTLPLVKQWVELSPHLSTLIVEEDRFAHATRINCAVGGACAMAMLFNTPIGGLLYMFEEISPTSWPVELTFRAFVATMTCALVSYGLLGLVDKEIREFVIFAWIPEDKTWRPGDLPIFVVLAAFLGAVTAYHTQWMLLVAKWRKKVHGKLRWPKLGVLLETTTYCVVCALISCTVSLASRCKVTPPGGVYVQFNCPDGQYNPVASLLVNTSHSAVKLLFSGNNEGAIQYRSSILAFVTYFVLNVGLAGLPVPGGAFTATMLLGGLFGRAVGSFMRESIFQETTAVSGMYAVVGAAAMLCGFKQMAAAVVLIVIQCINDMSVTPVVMLSVSVALLVNRAINERGHDEEQIERKNLPFLECEVPRILDDFVAGDLVDKLPKEAELSRQTSIGDIEKALAAGQVWDDFPVVEGKRCIGIITRAHLEAAPKAAQAKAGIPGGPSEKTSRSQRVAMVRVASGLSNKGGESSVPIGTVPADRIMDPTPFTIVEDMPAPRFYSLFSKVGERAALCVHPNGDYCGLISRTGLIAACRRGKISS